MTSKTIRDYIKFRQTHWKCRNTECGAFFTSEGEPDRCPVCKATHEKNEKKFVKPQPPVSNTTIRRELVALKYGFSLGIEEEPPLVSRVPSLKKLKRFGKAKERMVEIEDNEHKVILETVPNHLKGIIIMAYKYGFRLREIVELPWSEVDLRKKNPIITLSAERVKGKYARTIPLDKEAVGILQRQKELRMQFRGTDADTYVWHKNGKRIKNFRGWWEKARKAAGCPNKEFHDYRRTATRNLMWNSGLPEKAIQTILGWKTRRVMDHYASIKEQDYDKIRKGVEKASNGF